MKSGKPILILQRYLLPLLFICFCINSFCQKQSLAIAKVDNYNDSVAKHYFNTAPTLDPVEGIWQSDNGYKLSIEKNPENGIRNSKRFRAIILSSNYPSDFWKPEFIRAYIERTATPDIFYIDYFLGNHDTLKTETCKGYLDDGKTFEITFINNKSIDKINLYKIFPKQNDSQFTDKDIYSPMYGSGLIFTEDGYIVTNYHVVRDAKIISITGVNKDFKKRYSAKVIITDEVNDLALLKITDAAFKNFSGIPYTFRFDNIKQGEDVFALGYPDAIEMPESTTLSDGKITSTTGVNGNNSFYRSSVRLRPGNSGGPLFDTDGNIIGINNLVFTETENVSYAVNAKCIRALANLSDDKPLLPFLNSIVGKTLLEKDSILSNYVCIVDCNNYFKFSSFDFTNVKVLGGANTIGDSDNPESYYSLALYNINNKDYNSALDNLNKAINKGMKKTELYFLRGQIRIIQQKELTDAIDDFNYCMKNDADTSNLGAYYYFRGEVYDQLKKYDEAKKDYTTCINRDQAKVEESHIARALVNAELGEYNSAIEDWDVIIANMNDVESKYKAVVYYYKANCLLQIDKPNDALSLINQSLDIVTTDVKMWILRARVFYKLAKYDDAILDINKALSIDDSPEAYYVRSMAYKELGKKELACLDFNKAVSSGYKDIQQDMKNYCGNEK